MTKKIRISFVLIIGILIMSCRLAICSEAASRRIPDTSGRFYAGSTLITYEIGFNNSTYAYAWVMANDYVDGSMQLVVYYTQNGEEKTHIETRTFSQLTYKDFSYSCDGTITRIECWYNITSTDGTASKYVYAE